MKRFLQLVLLSFLTCGVISNGYNISKISGVYFDQSIIESIDTLNYIPTELINSNVIAIWRKLVIK